MHCGRQCATPNELLNAEPGDTLKGVLLGLGGGVNAFLCIVSFWQNVKNREELLKLRGFQCIGGAVHRPQ